jgi:peroxiredoxin
MTLLQDIENFKKEVLPTIPKDALETITKTSTELIEQNLESKALSHEDVIPSFMLPDAKGNDVSSEEFLKKGPVVISFYRGGWCPYCNLELKALQSKLPEIKALGAELIAISPELPDYSLTTQEKNALAFPVLSDKDNEVARKFGLVFDLDKELIPLFQKVFDWDLVAINGSEKVELPIPATYVVSRDGVIQFAFVNSDYTQRAEPDKILEVLRRISA